MNTHSTTPEDRDKNPEPRAPKLPESIMPDIKSKRQEFSDRSGKVVDGELVYIGKEYAALEDRQAEIQSMLNNGEIPDAPIDHEKLGAKLTKIQLSQADEMGKLAKNKLKAEHLDALEKISKYNQKRLSGYTEVVADGSKTLLSKIGSGTGEVLTTVGEGVGRGGLAIGKAALKLAGKGLKITAKAGRAVIGEGVRLIYDIADIHREYRNKHPKSID